MLPCVTLRALQSAQTAERSKLFEISGALFVFVRMVWARLLLVQRAAWCYARGVDGVELVISVSAFETLPKNFRLPCREAGTSG